MPSSDDVLDWTATEIRDAVAERRLAAAEVLGAFCARLDAVNPALPVSASFSLPGVPVAR